MRKIAANIIFPVSSSPVKNAYLVVDNDGTIIDVVQYNQHEKEIAGLEYYSGILAPGFVNAHCHIELSHLKGKIEQGKGLGKFVKKVQQIRHEEISEVEKQIENTLKFQWSRGINGMGDLVNSAIGLELKKRSQVLMHNFIELFNEGQKSVEEVINKGKSVEQEFINYRMQSSITAHSIYGTNTELLHEIVKQSLDKSIASIHFLESQWETQVKPEKLINYILNFTNFEQILLVHNLYLKKEHLFLIKQKKELFHKLHWVLCPQSNLFIQNKLPNLNLIQDCTENICLGTDSLASNTQLSILDEMKTLTANFADISFSTLLKWATLNGAKALKMDAKLGSFEKGKKPGVLLISDYDFKGEKLSKEAYVTRLI